MNARGFSHRTLSILLAACAVIPLLLTACQAVKVSVSVPTEPAAVEQPAAAEQPATAEPPAAAELPATAQPANTAQPAAGDIAQAAISLNLSDIAPGQADETVAAVMPGGDTFWIAVMPQHRVITLQGYPVGNHTLQPQIFIYPVADLAAFNKNARQAATDLQWLLQNKQPGSELPGSELPYLPLVAAKQVIHSQVQYLDFKSGKGARYLTQFNTGIVKVNNRQLTYTYQGLTSDGKYYVAAVLPVTHPELPDDGMVSGQPENHLTDLANTAAWLNEQPGGRFTPNLAQLDALVQSIEVK